MKKIFISIVIVGICCFNLSFAQTVSGIGIQLLKDPYNNKVFVYKVAPNSKAYQYGLKEGSEITQINDVDVKNLKINEISNLIQGKENTKVKLSVKYSKEQRNLEIPRKQYEFDNNKQEKFDVYWKQIAPSDIIAEPIEQNILNNMSKKFFAEVVPVTNYWISRKEEFKNSYYSCLLYNLKNQDACMNSIIKMSVNKTNQHYEIGFQKDLTNAKAFEKNISNYN